jgi:hypothetical protein
MEYLKFMNLNIAVILLTVALISLMVVDMVGDLRSSRNANSLD